MSLGYVNTLTWLLVVTDVMHEADDVYSIRSTWYVIGWINFSHYQSVHGFRRGYQPVVLDLSAIYFSHFGGCWASFVYNCHSIRECYSLFSGVKLSIRSLCFVSADIYYKNKQLKAWWQFPILGQSVMCRRDVTEIYLVYSVLTVKVAFDSDENSRNRMRTFEKIPETFLALEVPLGCQCQRCRFLFFS